MEVVATWRGEDEENTLVYMEIAVPVVCTYIFNIHITHCLFSCPFNT